jgi:hypothetical protein
MKSALFAALTTFSVCVRAENFPAQDLARHTIERRTIEAAIWGMPIVAMDAMRQAFLRDAGAKYNDIVYWSKQADWKLQVTTPNASSWYVYIAINTRDGPVVLDIPPAEAAGLFGSVNDAWQAPMADVGPTGEDQGKGAKYLLLPPGYNIAVPDGYIPVRFNTHNGYSILRAIPVTMSDANVAKALALVKKIRMYALSQAANPPEQRYIDMAGNLFDGIVRFDDTFYESLARMVNDEPVQTRDLVAMGQLKSLGIEKGKQFNPDERTREVLKKAVLEARAGWVQSVMALPTFGESSQWQVPASPVGAQTGFTFERDGRLELDERAALFFLGCAPAKKPGSATFYLVGTKDAKAMPFQGGKNYRLHIPPNVPARQFWAVTVYDLEEANFIRESPKVEVNSYHELQKNSDGSVDVYFGVKASAGKESNWVYTAPGKPWCTLFRFYGPEKPLFEKTWKLPDIEPAQGETLQPTGSPTATDAQPSSSSAGKSVPVTPDNFNRAETDTIFADSARRQGLGKLLHHREPMPIDFPIVRPNRDTLYSLSVFDLDPGPVTVTLPDTGKRFMSLQVIDEDQYTPQVIYGGGTYTFTREKIGTRYISLGVRILVDPADPADVKQVHALQDAIKVEQPGGPGKFEEPNWDPVSHKKVRDALLVLGQTIPDTRRMFGANGRVDPVRHLIGTAMGFGGNPDKDALYLNVTPDKNDGKTVYKLTVNEVPVDGFWSISVYNAEGHFVKNEHDAYTLNNITAKKNDDGSVTIQFGGCDGKTANCLPITPGWNYLVRLYRPRKEILDGTWKFPAAKPAQSQSLQPTGNPENFK